jgi:hypothetical protein
MLPPLVLIVVQHPSSSTMAHKIIPSSAHATSWSSLLAFWSGHEIHIVASLVGEGSNAVEALDFGLLLIIVVVVWREC